MKRLFTPQIIILTFSFCFVLAFFILLIIIPIYNSWGAYSFSNDFMTYFLGSKLFWLRQNIYDISLLINLKDALNLQFLVGQGFVYPPFLAVFLYPFSLLPVLSAIRLWYIFNVGVYALIGFILGRRLIRLGIKPGKLALCLFIFYSFAPLFGNFGSGQINILIFLFYVFFLICLERQKTILGGIFMAVAACLKVYPVLFLINQYLQKRIKVLFGFGLGVFIITGFTLLFNSWRLYPIYLQKVLPSIQSDFDPYFTNQSINAFVSRIFFGSDYGAPLLTMSSAGVKIIINLLVLSLFLMLVYLSIKNRRNKNRMFLLEITWLASIILSVGKSNFWTFIPTVLCFIFLLINWEKLLVWQRILFVTGVFLFYYQALLFADPQLILGSQTSFGKLGFIFLSGGFYGLVSVLLVLISLLWSKVTKEKDEFINLFNL